MICHAIRMWLLGLTVMSVASWATTASSFLILYITEDLSAVVLALLGFWTAIVPIPATLYLIWGWWRARVARQAYLLGQKHARLFDNVRGEISSSLR